MFKLEKALPFRFKAGTNMGPAVVNGHHHRSTTKQTQKPFKSRHATKSAAKDRFKGTTASPLCPKHLQHL